MAIILQVLGFLPVDAYDTKHKLSTEPQSHGRLALVDYCTYALLNVRLEDLRFGKLALDIGGEPDPSQRPGL